MASEVDGREEDAARIAARHFKALLIVRTMGGLSDGYTGVRHAKSIPDNDGQTSWWSAAAREHAGGRDRGQQATRRQVEDRVGCLRATVPRRPFRCQKPSRSQKVPGSSEDCNHVGMAPETRDTASECPRPPP